MVELLEAVAQMQRAGAGDVQRVADNRVVAFRLDVCLDDAFTHRPPAVEAIKAAGNLHQEAFVRGLVEEVGFFRFSTRETKNEV